MSGFSQFNHRGRFAEDIILHSSRLQQRRERLQMLLLTAANKPQLNTSVIPTETWTDSTKHTLWVLIQGSVKPSDSRQEDVPQVSQLMGWIER